jgi:hypothetical protein
VDDNQLIERIVVLHLRQVQRGLYDRFRPKVRGSGMPVTKFTHRPDDTARLSRVG